MQALRCWGWRLEDRWSARLLGVCSSPWQDRTTKPLLTFTAPPKKGRNRSKQVVLLWCYAVILLRCYDAIHLLLLLRCKAVMHPMWAVAIKLLCTVPIRCYAVMLLWCYAVILLCCYDVMLLCCNGHPFISSPGCQNKRVRIKTAPSSVPVYNVAKRTKNKKKKPHTRSTKNST